MPLRPQIPVPLNIPDNDLAVIRQCGIEWVSLMLKEDELTFDTVSRAQARLARYGLKVSDALCPSLQKDKSIHLGGADRDARIDRFNNMVRVFGQAGIPFTSIAWQPNGILRTDWREGRHTRGGIGMYCDQNEILSRPNSEERAYSEEEIWDNFRYFLEKTLPVCRVSGVRMALHPNDPPLACIAGIPSLIWNSDCYRRAFEMAGNSRILGIKLCVGCWLEGGAAFGDLMADIREFSADDRILCVHFRNVDAPLPVFEEVLCEDGYADMYAIMKQLVACGSNAVISIDHGFRPTEGFGGMTGTFIYPTGYMKGLLHAAENEIKQAAK